MGVAGSGKTTLGKSISKELNGTFIDADNFHTIGSISKMKNGFPLNEKDRKDWIKRLFSYLSGIQNKTTIVCACSALKADFQKKFKSLGFYIVFLKGDFFTLEKRIKNRQGHFFSEKLLHDQFENFDNPDADLTLDIKLSLKMLTQTTLKHIKREF